MKVRFNIVNGNGDVIEKKEIESETMHKAYEKIKEFFKGQKDLFFVLDYEWYKDNNNFANDKQDF